jgi:MSHA biogenesis protein MshI
MQLPWKRARSQDQLFVSWCDQTLAYVEVGHVDGRLAVRRMGVEKQGSDKLKDFASRLIELGLGNTAATALLTIEQSTLLQIAAPAVPPEELRSAVRYQIRDMVDLHIDDLILDVLHVGDGKEKSAAQVFVVTAANAVARDLMQLADAMEWTLRVIDVQEMAQRNLQTLWATAVGFADRASAALVLVSDKQALLTISAKGELYYSRRLDLPSGFLSMQWDGAAGLAPEAVDAYTPVGEYVPDYAGPPSVPLDDDSILGGNERAQRVLVEMQRSLDLWDRTWTGLPMAGVGVYASARSAELAEWLSRGLGHSVVQMDLPGLIPGVAELSEHEQLQCLPLLGLLTRDAGTAQQVNLCTVASAPTGPRLQARKLLAVLVFALVLLASVGAFWLWSLERSAQAYNQTLVAQGAEIKNLQAAIQRSRAAAAPADPSLLTALQARRLALLEREKVLQQARLGLFRAGEAHSDRLLLVTRSIPADTWISALKADSAGFEIAGFTQDPASLNDWVAQLARHPVMQGLQLSDVKVELVPPERPSGQGVAVPLRGSKSIWSFRLVSAHALAAPPATPASGVKP